MCGICFLMNRQKLSFSEAKRAGMELIWTAKDKVELEHVSDLIKAIDELDLEKLNELLSEK